MISIPIYSLVISKGFRSINALAVVIGKSQPTVYLTLSGERFGAETRELIERELDIDLDDYVPIPDGHRQISHNNGNHAEASAKAGNNGSQPGMKND